MTINLHQMFARFDDQWSPRIVAQLNDYHLKLCKLQGEFIWHSHPETDELFWVHKGELTIEYRDQTHHLKAGDLLVVPRGVEHRPSAIDECELILIEPAGTRNIGDAEGLPSTTGTWLK